MQSLNVSQLAGSTAVPERKGAIFSWQSFLFFFFSFTSSQKKQRWNRVQSCIQTSCQWKQLSGKTSAKPWTHRLSCMTFLMFTVAGSVWAEHHLKDRKQGNPLCIYCFFLFVFFKSPSIFCFWNKTLGLDFQLSACNFVLFLAPH